MEKTSKKLQINLAKVEGKFCCINGILVIILGFKKLLKVFYEASRTGLGKIVPFVLIVLK